MFELSGYTVGQRIGGGAQGETFSAVRDATGQPVAIKRLRFKDAPDWKSIELFEREGAALARMSHPAIARYVEAIAVAEPDGGETFYLVQELIAGESLDKALGRGERLGPDEVRDLLRQLAEVLCYIHRLNPPIIHRDIKPSNVMRRDGGGGLVLIDFGAIEVVAPMGALEAGSTIVGTTGYMPPEQLLGRSTPQSDLYALGATAAHLLTGVHPGRMGMARLRLDWRAWISPGVEVPPSLARVIDSLLEPAVEDRCASAAALRDMLASDEGSPEPAEPPAGQKERAAPWAALVVLISIALAGFVFGMAVLESADEQAASQRRASSSSARAYDLIPEVAHPFDLPLEVTIGPDLARTLPDGGESLRAALNLERRSLEISASFVNGAALLTGGGDRAWHDIKGRAQLIDGKGRAIASAPVNLRQSFEPPLHPGDVVGVELLWRLEEATPISRIRLEIVGAEPRTPAPLPADDRVEVVWPAVPPPGVALSFRLLSDDWSRGQRDTRAAHVPRIAVRNDGTRAIRWLKVTKRMRDPEGTVPPFERSAYAIAGRTPSLLPGEERVFGLRSYEAAALSEWDMVVESVTTGAMELDPE